VLEILKDLEALMFYNFLAQQDFKTSLADLKLPQPK
jgi:hypothetical protein